ncbi:MAG: type I-E CRISPR-associated protein Cse2/CasB [Clostridiaceae bacterium]|nr:type I-E CRISPR-associated protein Cse2/CasB [Clostridiaceae bacterium]
MAHTKNKASIYQVAGRILFLLSNTLETTSGKATLAKLRNSIGRDISQTVEVWPLVFENMPEEFLGVGSKSTAEERAVLHSLQLYALYQQGNSESVLMSSEEAKQKKKDNMGTWLATMRNDEARLALDRRFNTMITASTYEELLHYLRQMLTLLKSKSKGSVKINFAKLSEDLYWYIRGYEDRIRIGWAREYYRFRKQENTEKEGVENEE